MRLLSTFGRLPSTWPNLAFIVLWGMMEGFGLMLFVPLLQIMSSDKMSNLGPPFDTFVNIFALIGLPVTLLTMLTIICGVILASLALGYGQRYLLVKAKQSYTRQLRDQLASNLFAAEWSYIARQSHGEIFNQFLTESQRASNALQFELLAVASAVQIVIFMVLSSVLSWELAAVTLVFGLLVVAVVRPLQIRSRALGEATIVAGKNLSFHCIDLIKGTKLIKVMATDEAVSNRLAGYTEALYRVNFLSDLSLAQTYFLIQALPVFLLAIIIAISHEMLELNPSSTLVFLLFLARIAPRVAQLQQQAQGYALTSPAVRVVDERLAESGAAREDIRFGGKLFGGLENTITLDSIHYAYPGGDGPVLGGVSLTIKRNQMVAVVGKSGAGKSTLIDLLAGLRTTNSGHLAIDGIDLTEMNIASWRRRIGYVTQDVIAFNDTVLANLCFANPEASNERIAESMSVAHFTEVVEELPNGLDTVLGESGVRLSGGQKQRLALARALVGEPELLLLDEATSALDNESEKLIQNALESIIHTMTIVVIAHRLSTVRKADVIHVMEAGRIIESGTYDELVAKGGRFKDLHDLQFA